MELCRFLRWKGVYGRTWTQEEELAAAYELNDVPYTCLHTCEPWGPDDQPAELGTCQRARACFEPSPAGPPRRLS